MEQTVNPLLQTAEEYGKFLYTDFYHTKSTKCVDEKESEVPIQI